MNVLESKALSTSSMAKPRHMRSRCRCNTANSQAPGGGFEHEGFQETFFVSTNIVAQNFTCHSPTFFNVTYFQLTSKFIKPFPNLKSELCGWLYKGTFQENRIISWTNRHAKRDMDQGVHWKSWRCKWSDWWVGASPTSSFGDRPNSMRPAIGNINTQVEFLYSGHASK